MIQGTTKELEEKFLVNGIELDPQEWYTFTRILERCGIAKEIGKKKNPGAGRQSKILELPDHYNFSLTAK